MIFNISKGNHFSNRFLYKLFNLFHKSDRLSYHTTFYDTAIYNDDTVDRFDVNKLFGFSIGMHHMNSYRFGWNCLDGKIHIHAYSYVNGERLMNEVCTIDTNVEYSFIIKIRDGKVIFTVISAQDNIYQVIHPKIGDKLFGYKLWPYFGGNKTAPKDISIKLIKF